MSYRSFKCLFFTSNFHGRATDTWKLKIKIIFMWLCPPIEEYVTVDLKVNAHGRILLTSGFVSIYSVSIVVLVFTKHSQALDLCNSIFSRGFLAILDFNSLKYYSVRHLISLTSPPTDLKALIDALRILHSWAHGIKMARACWRKSHHFSSWFNCNFIVAILYLHTEFRANRMAE